MSKDLIQEWNNDPPPTGRFLEALAAYLAAGGSADQASLDRYDEMINAITTPQDLGQFLLEMSRTIVCEPIESRSVDRYWDALAGVVVVDGPQLRVANPWRDLARMLDKALYYE